MDLRSSVATTACTSTRSIVSTSSATMWGTNPTTPTAGAGSVARTTSGRTAAGGNDGTTAAMTGGLERKRRLRFRSRRPAEPNPDPRLKLLLDVDLSSGLHRNGSAASGRSTNAAGSSSVAPAGPVPFCLDEKAVRSIVRRNPGSASARYEFSHTSRGNVLQYPLFRVAALGASPRTIRLVSAACPEALSDVGPKAGIGGTPLHAAAAFNAPLATVATLFELCPEAAHKRTRYGYTPLHNACEANADDEVVEYLASVCPRALLERTKLGETPADIAERRERSPEVLAALAALRLGLSGRGTIARRASLGGGGRVRLRERRRSSVGGSSAGDGQLATTALESRRWRPALLLRHSAVTKRTSQLIERTASLIGLSVGSGCGGSVNGHCGGVACRRRGRRRRCSISSKCGNGKATSTKKVKNDCNDRHDRHEENDDDDKGGGEGRGGRAIRRFNGVLVRATSRNRSERTHDTSLSGRSSASSLAGMANGKLSVSARRATKVKKHQQNQIHHHRRQFGPFQPASGRGVDSEYGAVGAYCGTKVATTAETRSEIFMSDRTNAASFFDSLQISTKEEDDEEEYEELDEEDIKDVDDDVDNDNDENEDEDTYENLRGDYNDTKE